jgi:hypothetical protein
MLVLLHQLIGNFDIEPQVCWQRTHHFHVV